MTGLPEIDPPSRTPQYPEGGCRSLVQSMAEGVVSQDAEGVITLVNPAAERILGVPAASLLGSRLQSDIAILDGDGQVLPLDRLPWTSTRLTGKSCTNVPLGIKCRGGLPIWVAISTEPIAPVGTPPCAVVTTFRDITEQHGREELVGSERKQSDEALRRLNRTLLTLSSGNEALVRAGSEQDLLDRMCHILVEVGGHRVVWIDLTDKPNGTDMYPVASAASASPIRHRPERVPCIDLLAEVVNTGKPHLIFDVSNDIICAAYRENLVRAGCSCGLILPLAASRGPIGTLSIFSEHLDAFDKAEVDLLRELADDLAFGIQAQRINNEQQRAVARLQKTMEATIVALADTLELRDPYTAGHQRRVALLAKAIALRLGFDKERAEAIYLAGMIHDIGKIYVPSEVLSRPGRLTPLEYSLVQTHVEAAYGILNPIEFPWPLAEIVYQHHERLDGSGYPRGIRGEEITLDARILAVADVVEAMSAHRPYRPGLGVEAALAEIDSGRNTLFDPDVVDACIALFREEAFRFDQTDPKSALAARP